MSNLFAPLAFSRGPAMKNRFMLAPLTSTQSHADGRLSDDEFKWLEMRATGGFGLTMTCAAHVQASGQGFPGQLGAFSDDHLAGLTRMAAAIKAKDSIAVVQLHHAGMRAPAALIGEQPHCPSTDEETGARTLSTSEVGALVEDFTLAAKRAEAAGFDGVEVHGAHGYILSQFLSPEINRREDEFGGDLAGRSRAIFDIVNGIRARCKPDFNVSIRLSPERIGLRLAEVREVAQGRRASSISWICFCRMSSKNRSRKTSRAATCCPILPIWIGATSNWASRARSIPSVRPINAWTRASISSCWAGPPSCIMTSPCGP